MPLFKTFGDPLRTQFNDLPDRFSQSEPPLAASPHRGLFPLYARGIHFVPFVPANRSPAGKFPGVPAVLPLMKAET